MNKRKHWRIARDNHPSPFGTRIAGDNHSSRFGTRIAGDNHPSRFGTRITGDNHPSRFGMRIAGDNHPSRFGDDSISDNDTSFDLAQDDAILEELQAHWDELNRRVEGIIARHNAQPYRVKPELLQAIRRHRRQVVARWLLAACSLFATVYWAFAMAVYTTCTPVTAAALLLEAVFILVTAYGLHTAVRANRWEEPVLLNHYIPQMSTIIVAMLMMFPLLSYGQLGDGLVITQSAATPFDHTSRAETIQSIDNILNTI